MRGPGYFSRLYKAFFTASILGNIQYRASGVIWMIGGILEPTIFLIVWSQVAEARGGSVEGFTAGSFAAYYIVLMLVNHLTFSWIMQVFQFRIQFGGLSYELLRPIHPIHGDISDNLAYKLVQMVVMLPALGILVWLFEPDFKVEIGVVLLAMPIIGLAFITRFLLEWTLALVAFWTTRVAAINQTYFAVMMFLSGRVAPLALMPVWLQDVATALPFYYVVAFPVEVITGRVAGTEILDRVLVLGIWFLLALALMNFVWRRAVRNFSAVGG